MAGLDLDKPFEQAQSKDFKPIELSVRLQAHVASQVRPFVSGDVLAALPSTGPGATQAVLYTAHYDHLSVDPGMDGHNIYNGAVDNATGCGVLYELVAYRAPNENCVLVVVTFLGCFQTDNIHEVVQRLNHRGISSVEGGDLFSGNGLVRGKGL